jgi:16S rRNA (uracil1498-N3)-methyltransferase
MNALRGLPRVFIAGAKPDARIELPKEESRKFEKVLRLSPGDLIAVLPNDGTVICAEFHGDYARPVSVENPNTESPIHLTIAQSLPKGDKLEEIVRACTELGVSAFIFFVSDRSVVQWSPEKRADRLRRLETIAREACEVCFRTRLPEMQFLSSFEAVLREKPDLRALSEVDSESATLGAKRERETLAVGPEGGWSPRELELIGHRGVTLGPRVLRVDHAAPAAAALRLLSL